MALDSNILRTAAELAKNTAKAATNRSTSSSSKKDNSTTDDKQIFVDGNSEPGLAGTAESYTDPMQAFKGAGDEKLGSKIKRGAANAALGLKSSAKDFKNDLTTSLKDVAKGFGSSLRDRFLGKSDRNRTDDTNFVIQEKSIANRHKDAIESILKDTYNGNLFDAGLSAIQLYNFGTKWKFVMDQFVDKDMYPFRYWYYFEDFENESEINYKDAEGKTQKFKSLQFLDTIEDPTLLGYALRIDYDVSPLFKGSGLNQKVAEATDTKLSGSSELVDFINTYRDNYPELSYALTYLNEFRSDIRKIFESPESQEGLGYKNNFYKNHYIAKIDGLEKLDNPFVEYKDNDKEAESLTITLNEDVRMFVNRLSFLYRNLTYSNKMGKRLIPENLLRFNLYIKVSDYRSFTRNMGDEDPLREAMRNNYSRIIYELKECEFFFDKSLNPASLNMGGFSADVNKEYASLNLRIKYRKVNRIFYSSFFSADFSEMLIGDKYYIPDTSKYKKDALISQMIPSADAKDIAKKRKSTDNNIPTTPTIKERFDSLKNNGLVTQDDNDSAVTRFAKTITNEAVKAGAQVVDEGLKNIKDQVNDFTTKNSLRNLLQAKVISKIQKFNLGDVNSKIDPATPINKVDLHPTTNKPIVAPAGDLHPPTNQAVNAPNDDLHPTGSTIIDQPNEDLHDTLNQLITNPNENVNPVSDDFITPPSDDLHPIGNNNIVSPNEDLHPDSSDIIINPNEDLHPRIDQDITRPDLDLHPDVDFEINNPNDGNLMPAQNGNITSPNENINPMSNTDIIEPNNSINNDITYQIETPNENVNQVVNKDVVSPNENINPFITSNIKEPNDDLHPNTNHKIENSDKYANIKDYLKRKPKGDQ